MSFNKSTWKVYDTQVNLLNLFRFLHFDMVEALEDHVVFMKSKKYFVVIKTEEGYCYYDTGKPKEKLWGTDIIKMFVSGIETQTNASIWEKITVKYEEYLNSGENDKDTVSLSIVDKTFNHFEHVKKPYEPGSSEFYDGFVEDPETSGTFCMNADKEVLFPIYNKDHTICGYIKDSEEGIGMHPYSDINHGIWFNNIPKKIDRICLFNDPKEALAFYANFKPERTLLVALSNVNHATTKILFDIKKVSKAKKLVVSFTGKKKINGYIKDLNFISFLKEEEFGIKLIDGYINLEFKNFDDKVFGRFYNKIQEFNKLIAKEYVRYNDIPNQPLIQRASILPKRKDNGNIVCLVPIEVNAIKLTVWSYFRYFLVKEDLEVFKPKEVNWYAQYTTNKNAQEKHTMEEYKLAM